MTPDWWERIDRAQALAAINALVPAGGALILEGDIRSGLPQAARLAAHLLETLGYRVCRAAPPGGLPGLRPLLVDVWKHVVGPVPVTIVPPWVAQASLMTTRKLIGELRAVARQEQNGRLALVIEGLDSDEALPDYQVALLPEIADETGWPMVVLSRSESGTNWQASVSAGRTSHCALGGFSLEDVRDCVLTSEALTAKTPEQLAVAISLAAATVSDGFIAPSVAYSVLRAWTVTP